MKNNEQLIKVKIREVGPAGVVLIDETHEEKPHSKEGVVKIAEAVNEAVDRVNAKHLHGGNKPDPTAWQRICQLMLEVSG